MTEKQTKRGTCDFCGKEYAKGGIARHLAACDARQQAIDEVTKKRKKPQPLYHIQVQGTYNPEYWMHIEIPGRSKLSLLDSYLRMVWLECCGHLSNFTIGSDTYAEPSPHDMGFGFQDKSNNIAIKSVLKEGDSFSYIYDYGSSTELSLKVVGVRDGVALSKGREKVRLLAQNQPPDVTCAICKERNATKVCSYCIYDPAGSGWVCDECKSKHPCVEDESGDEYMLLAVVNSPRVGV
ncbi:MAG: hypothetical protein AAGK74_09395, partial [Chloroflexota bacterium]